MSNPVKQFYELGPFRIDVANRLLLRDGEPLTLTPKAVYTLIALVQHSGQILKKEELMNLVWPDSVVEEGNLTQNIYLLRKTLNEGSNGQRYIETIPRRGYRFVGEAHERREEAAAPLPAEQSNVQAVVEEKKTNEELKWSEGGSTPEPMAPRRPGAQRKPYAATRNMRKPTPPWPTLTRFWAFATTRRSQSKARLSQKRKRPPCAPCS
jgi:DNA-binding winged helix-turn-helix (wHTH) protein